MVAAVLSMLTGETIDPKTLTIDDLLYYICRYTADNMVQEHGDHENPAVIRMMEVPVRAVSLPANLPANLPEM